MLRTKPYEPTTGTASEKGIGQQVFSMHKDCLVRHTLMHYCVPATCSWFNASEWSPATPQTEQMAPMQTPAFAPGRCKCWGLKGSHPPDNCHVVYSEGLQLSSGQLHRGVAFAPCHRHSDLIGVLWRCLCTLRVHNPQRVDAFGEYSGRKTTML